MMLKMKKIKKRLFTLLTILMVISGLLIYAFLFAPNSLRVRYETIVSDKVPESLDNFTILVFSDLHYNHYTTKAQLENLVKTINEIGPNVVIFLGDLYDHPTHYPVTPEVQKELGDLLGDIDAKYGKFAILGNHDYESPSSTELVIQTLTYANFEIIVNGNQRLYFGGENYLELIAIDSMILGNPDISRSFKGISSNTFNIVIMHCPDTYLELDENLVDLVFAGHSHGGQIKIPLLDNYLRPKGAETYFTGKYLSDNGTLMDITNGVGTTNINARFNAPAEIVVYRIISGN